MDFNLSIIDEDSTTEFKPRVILSKTFVGTKDTLIEDLDKDIEKLLSKEASSVYHNMINPNIH